MLEILAAVYGVPVRTPLVRDAAGMGAAICAAVGTGMHQGWDDAVAAMVQVGDRVEVPVELQLAYRDVASMYARMVPGIHALFTPPE